MWLALILKPAGMAEPLQTLSGQMVNQFHGWFFGSCFRFRCSVFILADSGSLMADPVVAESLMGAVAVGRVEGVFAGAQPGVRVFLHLEGQRGEASVFMGTVAEGLVS
jgi:hypothetical protein